jgi:hypothetical protein
MVWAAVQCKQVPAAQVTPAAHWPSSVQLCAQSVAPHANGKHGTAAAGAQAPAPSHDARVTMPAAQLGAWHAVSGPG